MGAMAYARPDDNVAALATVTASAEDPSYPAAALVDLDVSNPAKLTTTSGGWVFDFGVPVALQAVALLNHNLDAGLDVRLQGNPTNEWGAPAIDEALVIPPDDEDGFSVGPWLDLRQPDGYEPDHRYWRIWVNGANSDPVALGEVVLLTTLREWWIDPAPGLQESEEFPDIVHESSFGGRTAYPLGTRWRIWDGAIPGTEVDDHWALARLARGRVRPWFFVPDQTANSAYLVTFDWSGPRLVATRQGGFWAVPAFRLREVSRGVPL